MARRISPTRRVTGLGGAAVLAALTMPTLTAQTLGTFRWQLLPFCNVITVTVVQQGSQYHVDGTDDLCGAARLAGVVGRAFPNPDGSIGFGLTTVSTTGAAAVHLDARISQVSLGGAWADSAGNSGTLVFTPGAGTGGSVRPIPPGGLPPGSITAGQLAPGTITAAQLAPGAIAGIAAGFGTCPAGQYLRGISPAGAVLCEPIGTPPLSTSVDTANNVGRHASIAIGIDGLPIISHLDATTGDLRVTHCSTVACVAATSTSVDTANSFGQYTSIAIGIDGLPIISHFDATNLDLRVTHCSTVACTAATSTSVDTGTLVGLDTSIAIGADGLPVISHYDAANGLRVTHCSNVACTAATSTSVDMASNLVGQHTSIAIGADGLPVVSHHDLTSGDLRVTRCSNVACTAATSTSVDTANNVGQDTSIAIGTDGLPVVSHHNFTSGDLRVTKCNSRTCQ